MMKVMVAKENNKLNEFSAVRKCENDSGQPLLLSAKDASGLLGIGRTLFYGLNSSGRLPQPVRLGGRVLWRRSELEDWTVAGCPNREKWEQLKQDEKG